NQLLSSFPTRRSSDLFLDVKRSRARLVVWLYSQGSINARSSTQTYCGLPRQPAYLCQSPVVVPGLECSASFWSRFCVWRLVQASPAHLVPYAVTDPVRWENRRATAATG